MENSQALRQLTNNYLLKYPKEEKDMQKFLQFLQENDGEQLYHRKNFSGHVTAGAFVVNPIDNKVLLLEHKFLKKWLQPGGHVDMTDDNIMAAALRECVEETALQAEDLKVITDDFMPFDVLGVLPFDLDAHPIPSNAKKQEDAHYHFDVRYLFVLKSNVVKDVTINANESTDAKWFSLPVLASREGIFQRVAMKMLYFTSTIR